jgi:hypothetical protein
MPNYVNTQSTFTLQREISIVKSIGDINPIFNVVPHSIDLPLAIANDVMNAILSDPFPYKWNEIFCPQFVTNSFQQDYAGIYPNVNGEVDGGLSLTNLSWLERGIVVDINNTAQPKPYRQVEVGRQLPQATGTFWNSATNNPLYLVNYFPNNMLYYGTWGKANVGSESLGNNPGPGAVYLNPLGLVGGQAQSQPPNPITQIQDANGNFLVVTTYGTCGLVAPSAPANSAAGTIVVDGTTHWTVVDPFGQGFRILPVPTQTGVVWQFTLIGQALPIKFTSLTQTLFPVPDQYEPNFRQMFTAQCYRYSTEAKVRAKFDFEWKVALEALVNCRKKSDRETEENIFTPDRGVMGPQQGRNRWQGSQWPFQYPLQ